MKKNKVEISENHNRSERIHIQLKKTFNSTAEIALCDGVAGAEELLLGIWIHFGGSDESHLRS